MFAGQHRADAAQPRAPFFGDLGGGEGTTVVLWHCSLVSARMGHGGSLARLGGGLVKRPACQSTIAEAFRRPGTDRRCQARRSEEHTSELQSLMRNSYAVLCLNKTKRN